MDSRIRWGGLRTKMIAWFLVPTVIILSMVALFTFYTYRQVTEKLVLERNRDLIHSLSHQMTIQLMEFSSELYELTMTPEIYRQDPLIQQNYLRLSMGRLILFDGGVVILDASGVVVAADPRRLDAVGQDWSDRSYVHQMSESPRTILSNIVTDGPEGAQVVALAVPVRGGLVVGMFTLDANNDIRGFHRSFSNVAGTLDRDTHQVYLVDGRGRVIQHSSLPVIGEDQSASEVVRRVLAGETGSIRMQDQQGQEVIASFAPIGAPVDATAVPTDGSGTVTHYRRGKVSRSPDTAPRLGGICASWGLVVVESWDEVVMISWPYERWLLGLLALGLVIPALVMSIGGRRITSPVLKLTRAAQEVAGGNLGRSIVVRTKDEIAELAKQFNDMSAQLQASYAHLEQRVADRTRELATLNELGQALTAHLNVDQVVDEAYRGASRLLDTTNFYAALYDADNDEITFALWATAEKVQRPHAVRPLGQGLTGHLIRNRSPLLIKKDVSEWMIENGIEIIGPEALSWLGVPLIVGERVFGVMAVQSYTTAGLYDEHDRDLMMTIANQAAIAVQNAWLYEQAQELATVEERQRLARDLHDAVSQTLFSASMIADVLPRIWETKPEEGRRRLEELRQLTRGALAEMRTLLFELRPAALVETPLADLLRQLGEAVTGRARLPVTLEVAAECELPPDAKVAFYRITQEALNNVVKHAGASQVTVRLQCDLEQIELHIRDDGCGFDPADIPPDHFGVGIMRERAEAVGALLTLTSKIDQGTEVVVAWTQDSDEEEKDEE